MLREVPPSVVAALRRKLRDPSTRLEHKYRILFSLRGLAGSEAHAAMLEGAHICPARRRQAAHCQCQLGLRASCLSFPVCSLSGLKDKSALFRHEVAYCLGQRQDPAAVCTLKAILKDTAEHPMVCRAV